MRENDLATIGVDVAFHTHQRMGPTLNEFGLETLAMAQIAKEERCNVSSSLRAFAPLRETVFNR